MLILKANVYYKKKITYIFWCPLFLIYLFYKENINSFPVIAFTFLPILLTSIIFRLQSYAIWPWMLKLFIEFFFYYHFFSLKNSALKDIFFLKINSLLKVFDSIHYLCLLRVYQRQHMMKEYLTSKLTVHNQLQLLHFIFQFKGG